MTGAVASVSSAMPIAVAPAGQSSSPQNFDSQTQGRSFHGSRGMLFKLGISEFLELLIAMLEGKHSHHHAAKSYATAQAPISSQSSINISA